MGEAKFSTENFITVFKIRSLVEMPKNVIFHNGRMCQIPLISPFYCLEKVHYHGCQIHRIERKVRCKKEEMCAKCSSGEEYYRDDPICNLKPAEFSSSYPQLLSCLQRREYQWFNIN